MNVVSYADTRLSAAAGLPQSHRKQQHMPACKDMRSDDECGKAIHPYNHLWAISWQHTSLSLKHLHDETSSFMTEFTTARKTEGKCCTSWPTPLEADGTYMTLNLLACRPLDSYLAGQALQFATKSCEIILVGST